MVVKKRLVACYSLLWFMQRLIISLQFVNTKCHNFHFICLRGWALTNIIIILLIKKMKVLAMENCLPDIGFTTHRVLFYNSF